jgi:hypothetical protein
VIHHNPVQTLIPGDGLYRTNNHTGSVLALLTGHWDIKPLFLPFHNLDPASGSIGYAVMKNRADELAEPAASAFFRGDLKNFTHGFHSFSPFVTTDDSNLNEFHE